MLHYGNATGISADEYHQDNFGNDTALLCLGVLFFLRQVELF